MNVSGAVGVISATQESLDPLLSTLIRLTPVHKKVNSHQCLKDDCDITNLALVLVSTVENVC